MHRTTRVAPRGVLRLPGGSGARVAVVTALRSEHAFLSGTVPRASLFRSGMGPAGASRVVRAALRTDPSAIVVAGVAGGLDPALRAGDVVVATEVRDEHGRTALRAAAPLVAELRALGLRVHSGPIVSRAEIVGGAAERDELRADGALAVDMESAAIARAVAERGGRCPVAVVRVVVDTAHAGVVHPATVPNGLRALLVLRRAMQAVPDWAGLAGGRRVLLAGPRSFCAGVDRAIEIVERALKRYPHPVYVRRQIVHNVHVVDDLRRRGAVFVDELSEVPAGTTVVFSAHGVPPSVRAEADRRGLTVVDATCPLVAKVHAEARRFSARGDTVLFVGHAGHDETEGTMGQVPGNIRLVETPEQAAELDGVDGDHVAVLLQTTLAADDAGAVTDVLRERFPALQEPPTDDICYATTNRQHAVRAIAADSDVVLVLGSVNSSNSRRLVEVAERCGVPAFLVDDATAIRAAWLRDARTVGITAGASAPPYLVDEVVATLRGFGPVDVEDRSVVTETTHFALPRGVTD